jgi:arginase family enzyme
MQWTGEAMCDAGKIMFGETWSFADIELLRAALDAAVKTQMGEYPVAFLCGKYEGRNEALEEAAKVAESGLLPFSLGGDHILDPATAGTIAENIRALKTP